MARELLEELTYQELESMAKDQSAGGSPQRTNNGDTNMEELFGKIKRKLSQPFVNMEQYVTQVSSAYSSRYNSRQKYRQARNTKRNSVNGDLPVKYQVHERIELAHFDSMFGESSLRDRKTYKLGNGHDFQMTPIANPAFCDHCRDPIWGMTKKCPRCSKCKYTCHHRCRQLVTLDCEGQGQELQSVNVSSTSGTAVRNTSVPSVCDHPAAAAAAESNGHFTLDYSGYHDATSASSCHGNEVKSGNPPDGADLSLSPPAPIGEPSDSCHRNSKLGLTMDLMLDSASVERIPPFPSNSESHDDNTFQDFIRVTMNLSRPINMFVGSRPPSILEVLAHEDLQDHAQTICQTMSFYIPKDTIKSLHISRCTTASEVISELLHKFKITDSPRKFALYEQFHEENSHIKLRKIREVECPLELWLKWKEHEVLNRKFVLQENETGDIMWEAFSIPELHNFVRILEREEDDHVEQIRTKFKVLRLQLSVKLRQAKPRSESEA